MGYSMDVEITAKKHQTVRINSYGMMIFSSNCLHSVEIKCLKEVINVANHFGYAEDDVGRIIMALTGDEEREKKH